MYLVYAIAQFADDFYKGYRPLGAVPVMVKFGKCVLVAFITWALFEIFGQTIVFRDKLYFVNDVDHRMEPYSAIDINSDGVRAKESGMFPAEDTNIVFLGDSFVYGFRLPYHETVPQQLEQIARQRNPQGKINVANFGWISSSPLLSYRLLKDIGEKYNPDVVLLAVDMSDFEDDIKYRELLERRGVYRLLDFAPITMLGAKKLTRKVKPLNFMHESFFSFPAQKFFVTANPASEMLPYYSYIRRSIEDTARFTRRELNAEFILLILPRSYQYSDKESPKNWEKDHYEVLGPYAHEPFKYFDSIRDEVNFPIYSLLEDFQQTEVFPTCLEYDPHWNADGARVAAEAVYNYCEREGCFARSTSTL